MIILVADTVGVASRLTLPFKNSWQATTINVHTKFTWYSELDQLDMANMWSEYVKWLSLETFLISITNFLYWIQFEII